MRLCSPDSPIFAASDYGPIFSPKLRFGLEYPCRCETPFFVMKNEQCWNDILHGPMILVGCSPYQVDKRIYSCQPVIGSHDVISSMQFTFVGVNSRSFPNYSVRRSDSLSIRCRQISGVLVLEGGDEDGGDELDDEQDGRVSSAETSTDQK